MKFLSWLLGLFALAVALVLAAHNPGYVLLVYPPWRMEMSLSLFAVGLLALLLAALLAARLVSAALRLPEQVRRFRAERAQARRRATVMDALTAFFEGRLATAEKAAGQAIDLGDDTSLTPIVAARAAHELREFDRRDAYLAAAGNDAHATAMRLMAAAEFSLDQRRPVAALDALKELRKSGARSHVGALRLELRAQQQCNNWDAVLDLAEQLEKREALDATYAAQLRQQAWLEKLREAQDAAALNAAWKIVPAAARLRTRIAEAAAHAFMRLDDFRNARRILTDSLEAQWDSGLAALYGDIAGDDALGQIEQAERWLTQHHDDAGLLLALGKLCLRQHLWGKAQTYLDASISLSPSRAAYMALGQLAEELQKPDEAFGHFRKAMELQA